LDVNGTQPGPTSPKASGPKQAPGYGSDWVALGLVASFLGLITQRAPAATVWLDQLGPCSRKTIGSLVLAIVGWRRDVFGSPTPS
jgi:hypothetical protein